MSDSAPKTASPAVAQGVGSTQYYATFMNYICTANVDLSIPLNATAVCMVVNEDSVLLHEMLDRANAAPDLLAACEAALNARMFKDWPEVATLLQNAIAKVRG